MTSSEKQTEVAELEAQAINQIGKCTLINEDCITAMDKLIAEGIKVDCILTDPPYGTTACKWDSVIPFDKMWERLNKIIKDNGAIVLFGSEPFSSALRMSNIKNYKYDWIWDKKSAGNFMNAKYQPLKTFENISVFSKSKHNYYPIFKENKKDRTKERPITKKSDFLSDIKSGFFYGTEKNKKGSQRYPKAIIEISKQSTECSNSKSVHPTQKPVELMEYLIKTYTNEGETVLDFAMGSGSTGVACQNLNRQFIGIEYNPIEGEHDKFYNIGLERIKKNGKK